MSTPSGNGGPDPSSVTVFRSSSVSLRGTTSLPKILHQISRQLPVLSLIGLGQDAHHLLVIVHHLALDPWYRCLSFLAIHDFRVRVFVSEMLDPPPLVCGAMKPAGGGRLDAMFP